MNYIIFYCSNSPRLGEKTQDKWVQNQVHFQWRQGNEFASPSKPFPESRGIERKPIINLRKRNNRNNRNSNNNNNNHSHLDGALQSAVLNRKEKKDTKKYKIILTTREQRIDKTVIDLVIVVAAVVVV